MNRFRYLFLLLLREAKKDSSLGEVIIAQLLRGMEGITPAGVENFIRKNQSRCCFLLDGLDEFKGSIVPDDPQSCSSPLGQLMLHDKFSDCFLVVTSRHNKKDEFETGDLDQRYTTVELEGFTKEAMETYVTKIFHKTPSMGKELLEDTETQYALASLVSIPFFCMALCSMKKGNALKDIGTRTKFFNSLIMYLVHHARAKGNAAEFDTKRVNSMIPAVGEVALKGLIDDELIFSRSDFNTCLSDLNKSVEVGLLSEEKSTCDPEELSDEELEVSAIEFFHKLAQEYCAGKYLASTDNCTALESTLRTLDNADKVLALENVLQFAVGSSSGLLAPITKHINTVWKGKGDDKSRGILLRLLSESTDSVGDDLNRFAVPLTSKEPW